MNDLERALVALGHELDLPPAPDLAAAVRPRLRRRSRRRLALAAALALLAAAAVALAVPGARSAILRFFHLRGASVTIVDRLPEVPLRSTLPGEPSSVAAAPFRVLLPEGERPDEVRLDAGSVWLRYGPASHPRLVVAETRTGGPWFVKKAAATGTTVRYASVGRDPALWIEGAPHQLALPAGETRLAGNTLVWQHGPLTLRVEADVDLARARALATSFR